MSYVAAVVAPVPQQIRSRTQGPCRLKPLLAGVLASQNSRFSGTPAYDFYRQAYPDARTVSRISVFL